MLLDQVSAGRLEVRDIEFWPNGTGQALIRRGKTDFVAEVRGHSTRMPLQYVETINAAQSAMARAAQPLTPQRRGRSAVARSLGILTHGAGGDRNGHNIG